MLLKRQSKAGILLYALFMSAIFVLLLQFYLNRVVAMECQQQSQLSASRAYLMAEVTKELAKDDSGELVFKEGLARYKQEKEQLQVSIHLEQGDEYSYRFQQKAPAKLPEEKRESSTEK